MHLAILQALAQRDTAAALAAMRVHLDSARSTLLQSIHTRELAFTNSASDNNDLTQLPPA